MKLSIVLAAIVASLVVSALPIRAAGEVPVNCKNPATTYEINVCAGRVNTAANAALNALYRQLAAKYDANNNKLLQAAQRSWLKFRDDECAYETSLTAGGTIHSTMVTDCDTALTRERIKRLQMQADCEEGDMSCNHP